MDPVEILKSFVAAGSAGLVIYVVMLFLGHIKELQAQQQAMIKELQGQHQAAQTQFLDRLTQIETRHTEEERLARSQIGSLFEQTRSLFDRVIAICVDLTQAVTALKDATRANEIAIKSNEQLTQSLYNKTDMAIKELIRRVEGIDADEGRREQDAADDRDIHRPQSQLSPPAGRPKRGESPTKPRSAE